MLAIEGIREDDTQRIKPHCFLLSSSWKYTIRNANRQIHKYNLNIPTNICILTIFPSWGNWPIWRQHLSKRSIPYLYASYMRGSQAPRWSGSEFLCDVSFSFSKIENNFLFPVMVFGFFPGLFEEVGVLSELLLRSGFHSSRSAALVKTLNQINRPIDRWWISQIWRPSIRLASEVST